jgi:hypothetical protein
MPFVQQNKIELEDKCPSCGKILTRYINVIIINEADNGYCGEYRYCSDKCVFNKISCFKEDIIVGLHGGKYLGLEIVNTVPKTYIVRVSI